MGTWTYRFPICERVQQSRSCHELQSTVRDSESCQSPRVFRRRRRQPRASRCNKLPETRLHRRNFSSRSSRSLHIYVCRVCRKGKVLLGAHVKIKKEIFLSKISGNVYEVRVTLAETRKSTPKWGGGNAWHSERN